MARIAASTCDRLRRAERHAVLSGAIAPVPLSPRTIAFQDQRSEVPGQVLGVALVVKEAAPLMRDVFKNS